MNSSKKVLEICFPEMKSLMLGWVSQCINNTEKISLRRQEEAIETFLRYSDITDTEPDSLVPFKISGIKVLYLESGLLLGSHLHGP